MAALGITESFKVKQQVLMSASEAAEMILRVDEIIKAAPRYNICYPVCVCGVVIQCVFSMCLHSIALFSCGSYSM